MSLSNVPLEISDDRIATQQICHNIYGLDFDSRSGDDASGFLDGDEYRRGQALQKTGNEDTWVEWVFDLNYTIPESDIGLELRDEKLDDGDTVTHELYLDGELVAVTNWSFTDLNWRDYISRGEDQNQTHDFGDLEPGTHTVRLECVDDDDPEGYILDSIAVFDERYRDQLTFDNTTTDGHLDGPELFPELVEVSFSEATTRRNVTEANFTSIWNDVSNSQYVELANDGSTFTRFNNADSGSTTFAEPDSGVDVNIGLSRFGQRDNPTPRFGFNGQHIDVWELYANPDAVVSDNIGETLSRAIVPPDTLAAGTTLREAGLKSDDELLTRHVLAEFDVLEGQRISSSETTRFTGEN